MIEVPTGPAIHASFLETAGTVTVQVGRFGGKTGAISVDFTTSDDTAMAGSDYVAASGTLDWADGDDAPKGIQVQLLDDQVLEDDEWFVITLSMPLGTTICDEEQVRIRIFDDELPGGGSGGGGGGGGGGPCDPSNPDCSMVTFSDGSTLVFEDDGTVQIQVERRGATTGMVSVDVGVTGGSATEGIDFAPVSVTLTWPDGNAASKFVPITIIDDADQESEETVQLSFMNATRSGAGCIEICGSHTLFIDDDDGPGQILFFNPCVDEAEGTVQLPVARVGGSTGAVSVSFQSADGSATSPADYGAVSGQLAWGDGDDATKFIPVSIVNDGVQDFLEDFTVQFSAPTGGVVLEDTTMLVTIVQGRVFSFPVSAQADECDGFVSVKLTVACDSIDPGDGINYSTTSGSATAGSDFVASSGMAIVDFDGTAEVFIALVDDGVVEGNETFTINVGISGQISVTILDDDPHGTVECRHAHVTFNEDAGAEQLFVERGPCATPGPVSVDWMLIEGTALLGADYGAPSISGTFTWVADDFTDRAVDISLVNDGAAEGPENFFLVLSNASGASLGTQSQTEVEIIDDDGPGCVAFL
jgi:hypothetical protein